MSIDFAEQGPRTSSRALAAAAAYVALSIALLAACASRGAPSPYYVLVAEALSAPTLNEGMRVTRMFSGFQLTEACRTIRPVARLETPFRSLGFRVGERFPLSALNVVAVNAANLAVRDVPVAIEAEEMSPPVVQLRSDDPYLAQGRLNVIAEGTFRIRVRTICGTPPVETVITARSDSSSD